MTRLLDVCWYGKDKTFPYLVKIDGISIATLCTSWRNVSLSVCFVADRRTGIHKSNTSPSLTTCGLPWSKNNHYYVIRLTKSNGII